MVVVGIVAIAIAALTAPVVGAPVHVAPRRGGRSGSARTPAAVPKPSVVLMGVGLGGNAS